MYEIPDWPRSLGIPDATGFIREAPEDFIVEEIPRVEPCGEGTHLWLWVEKRSANTDWVARELAALAGCRPRDVGYAGLKDRHAVTRQWFSVPFAGDPADTFRDAAIDGVRVLDIQRHTRKLKRGTLDGNRFSLSVRGIEGDTHDVVQRLERVRLDGVPNYFGPQRFGRGGSNVGKAVGVLGKPSRRRDRKQGIYLSAVRSFLFNQVLAERVIQGDWNRVVGGDVVMLDGTHSIFPCPAPDADIEDRCRRHDIHPTGPLPGTGGSRPADVAADLEDRVLRAWPELTGLLDAHRATADRRALRLCPKGLEWRFGDGVLQLEFTLPPGAYATVVLREIIRFEIPAEGRNLA